MTIHVNGEPTPFTTSPTVAAIIDTLDLPRTDVAVAVDGRVVPRSQWETTVVDLGAKVEVVTAMQGG